MDYVYRAYHKSAPRWFKVIQWKRIGVNWAEDLFACSVVGIWGYVYLFKLQPHREAWHLFIRQPQTEEERMFIKRQFSDKHLRVNWEPHHYERGAPPTYDMWERRRKYPEYYAGRYEGDGPRYGDAVQKK